MEEREQRVYYSEIEAIQTQTFFFFFLKGSALSYLTIVTGKLIKTVFNHFQNLSFQWNVEMYLGIMSTLVFGMRTTNWEIQEL